MNQGGMVLPAGLHVKTHAMLGDTRGMLISRDNLIARVPDVEGVTDGWVPGHGGDVYWVKHDWGGPVPTIAAYSFTEFELMPISRFAYFLYCQYYRLKWKYFPPRRNHV